MTANRTPDLSTVIRGALDSWSASTRVMLPAKIVSYDHTKQLAVVQPILQETEANGEIVNLPQIVNVPVQWMRVGLAVIYMPLKRDDLVMLIFSDRSLDNWEDESKDGKTLLDPQDVRTHDLSDAIAVPGLYPPGIPIPNVDPADLRLILFDSSGNVRSQIYLGGDTGDMVAIAENKVMLGSATPTKGSARNTDPTLSTIVEDATYWAWILGFVNVLLTWVVVPTDGGAALKTAMIAYIAANPVPQQLAGKISAGSTKVFAED